MEKELKRTKKIAGITLIALVITIVVLIILAGVLINISLGNNGLFNKAKTAKEMYANAQNYEETEIAKITNSINGYVDGNRNNDFDTLKKEVEDLRKEVNTLKLNQNSGNFVVFDKNNVIKATTECAAGTEYTYTATQDCAISYSYYFKLADGGVGVCKVDDITIAPGYCSAASSSQYLLFNGIVYIKTGQVFTIKSVNYNGDYTVYGLK